jgi:hypothetical protein
MSTATSAQRELPSLSDLDSRNTALPLAQAPKVEIGRTATFFLMRDSKPYSPVNGLVGHCFVRVCLLCNLLAFWKRSSYTVSPHVLNKDAVSESGTKAASPAVPTDLIN